MPYTNNLTSIELYPTVSDSCVCHVTSLVSQLLPSSVRHRYSDREQNRKAAYPADASDGRDLCRVAIREHLVEVTPKQMHLVSSQIELRRTDNFFFAGQQTGQADGAAPHMVRGAPARRPFGPPDSDGSGVRIASLGTSADTTQLRRPGDKYADDLSGSARRDYEERACGVLPSLADHCIARC